MNCCAGATVLVVTERVPVQWEAAVENIELRYELIARTPNTRAAHRLVEWMYTEHGWQAQHALVEALFRPTSASDRILEIPSFCTNVETLWLDRVSQGQCVTGEGQDRRCAGAELIQLQRGGSWGCRRPGYTGGRICCRVPRASRPCKPSSSGRNKVFCRLTNSSMRQRPDTLRLNCT